MLQKMVVPVPWKAGDTDNEMVGYASTFGNVDLGGDVVVRGAFAESVKAINGGAAIPLLADHVAATDHVLGSIRSAHEDATGLAIDAVFASTPRAQEVRVLLLEGHLSKLSIGYETLEDAFEDRGGRRIRVLKAVKLWETSVVVFPMNPQAAVTRVKDDASDVEALEQRLRSEETLLRLERTRTWR